MSFDTLGLSTDVLRAISESGYTTPTPIQEKAIPYVLMGRDVLGVAQTGTGKTAGFTLPMIDILSSGRGRARMPRSLILEPTRELATQVAESFNKYGKHSGLSMALLIGGESMRDQQLILQRGVDVLIATPGRLLDLFERGQILLADTKLLVIDEADRMLDMGFIPDIERIVAMLPTIRQTLFFSATMAPEIRKLADKFLLNPKEISVAPPASPAKTVTQRLLRCEAEAKTKRAALRSLLQQENADTKSALIFCNRKRDVTIVQRSLKRHGLDAEALHGDMAQASRTETLARFKAGEIRLLVCSDVAARGLDIPAVSHVYNYDVPIHAEDYVHRIGRTGRAGRSGKAFTLFTPDDGKALAGVQELIGGVIEELTLDAVETPDSDAYSTDKRRRTRAKSGKSSKSEASPPKQQPAKAPEPKSEEQRPSAHARKSSKRPPQREREQADAAPEANGPFGDHIPAFILRPVPLTASA
ncbi:DEAD/DEAH box helicase [Aquibaculum sediminis]|uniref:DEAD/DEAH box helicase n=1 Tax=Aquibaculum sediminis TaxID=3231907 RepID=UPI003456476D